MNPETVRRLKLEIKAVGLGDSDRPNGVSGKPLRILETVQFELKIGGYAFPTKATVVADLSESLLLGSYFFSLHTMQSLISPIIFLY